MVRAVFDFCPSVSEELPLFVGDVIEVLAVVDEFWLLGKKENVTGKSWKCLHLDLQMCQVTVHPVSTPSVGQCYAGSDMFYQTFHRTLLGTEGAGSLPLVSCQLCVNCSDGLFVVF